VRRLGSIENIWLALYLRHARRLLRGKMDQKVWLTFGMTNDISCLLFYDDKLFSFPLNTLVRNQGVKFTFRHVNRLARCGLALKGSAMSRAVVPRTPHEVAGEQEFRAVDRLSA
jgi:hypothetical protein